MAYVDPMPIIKGIVAAAAPDLAKVTVGPPMGNEPDPFAIVRSVGGPEEDAQDIEQERRIDVTVFAKSIVEANRLSNDIHRSIRRRHQEAQEGETQLPSIFSAGGPLDLVDPDRLLPGVFRSYYVIFAEDDGA